jgi:ribonuclease M5
MIKEVIVVEGRDDVVAVKKAVDAEVIAVGGFGINYKVIDIIREAQKRQGVIVLTDPDFAGGKIREIISKRVKGIKHAYISKEEASKDGDIGVENASAEAILNALKNAHFEIKEAKKEFSISDLLRYNLTGNNKSKELRERIGKNLGIGYSNSAQFINRLNNYGITREEFLRAVDMMYKENNK